MAERSWPWPGVTVGDAGTYSDNDWDDMWEILYGSGLAPYNDRGVVRNWLNELEVTDPAVANRVDVDTGAALVHGKFYDNTALVNIVGIPNSGAPWREDLICLQSDWVAQTIRIYRHQNPADGAGVPPPTQNDGVLWEIPLAAVRIDAGGTIIGVWDMREYLFVTELEREICKRPLLTSASTAIYSWGTTAHFFVLLAAGEDCFFELLIPANFREVVEVIVYVSSPINGTLDWQCDTGWGNCDEARELHTDTANGTATVVINAELECIDVSAAFDAFPITPGDLMGIRFRHIAAAPAGDKNVYMLAFRYK